MTRYAIISDIHANIEALDAVLQFISTQGIDEIRCLGDIVGYGPNPNECVERIRERNIPSLMGNHEYMVLNPKAEIWSRIHNPDTVDGTNWTRNILTEDNKRYISGLSLNPLQIKDFIMAHGSLKEPEKFHYVHDKKLAWDPNDLLWHYKYLRPKNLHLHFYGHSHIGVRHLYYEFEGKKYTEDIQNGESAVDLNKLFHERGRDFTFSVGLINVGSVGQPRDKNTKASLVIYDDATKIIEHHRVAYDVNAVYQRSLALGLPEFYATRLLEGK